MIVHEIEQTSPEWFTLRAGMPTGSNFSKIITSKGEASKSADAYARLLAAELYAGKSLDEFQGTFYTDRGKELEADARAMYEFYRDTEIQQVGFITDDLKRYGVSPDGLFEQDGMTEFKCLKTENHVNAILYYQKYKKCPADYVQQTQGQIYIAEREWCDLAFYHPDLPFLVIRQYRDDAFIKALQAQLSLVLSERDKILEAIKAA